MREQHVRQLVDEVEDQRAAPAEAVQRKAEQHREQQHLQDVALGERVDDRVGNDVQQEVDRALHLARARRRLRRAFASSEPASTFMPAPGCTTLTIDQADDQRERAHDLEVERAPGRRSCRPSSCPPCRRCRSTTVQKMIGAIIILMSLMKPSPSGFIASPVCGKSSRAARRRDGDEHLQVERFPEWLRSRTLTGECPGCRGGH